jgi:hypothetical protein
MWNVLPWLSGVARYWSRLCVFGGLFLAKKVAPSTPLQLLFQRLDAAGVPESWIRKSVLPLGWKDSLAGTQQGFRRACAAIARSLDIDLKSLLSEDPHPQFNPLPNAYYKKAGGKDDTDIQIASRAAVTIAKLAIEAKLDAYCSPSGSAADVRKEILKGFGRVNLESLLNWCWSYGMPVLHLQSAPGKKMDGLAVAHSNQAAIIVVKNDFPSRLAFIVAHELGHVALGHVNSAEGFIADERVDRGSTDKVEIEANRFACELLTGVPEPDYTYEDGRWRSGTQLAKDAQLTAEKSAVDIDASSIVNNWCFREVERLKSLGLDAGSIWGIGANALKALGEESTQGPELIRAQAKGKLDVDELTHDSADLVQNLTGSGYRAG